MTANGSATSRELARRYFVIAGLDLPGFNPGTNPSASKKFFSMDARVISAFTRVHSPRRRASTPSRTRFCPRMTTQHEGEESAQDGGEHMTNRVHDRASGASCKARVVAFPCFGPVPPCYRRQVAATRKTPAARISRVHPAAYGETRGAGLWPAAGFSPVIYREKQEARGLPSQVAAGGADHYLTRCRRGRG